MSLWLDLVWPIKGPRPAPLRLPQERTGVRMKTVLAVYCWRAGGTGSFHLHAAVTDRIRASPVPSSLTNLTSNLTYLLRQTPAYWTLRHRRHAVRFSPRPPHGYYHLRQFDYRRLHLHDEPPFSGTDTLTPTSTTHSVANSPGY